MISLSGVSKAYGPNVVLRPTTLALAARARLALVGPSGCGKSTLVRVVLGLCTPDTGTVRLGDIDVTAKTSRAACLRAGYVMQDGALFPHLTARRNVEIVARHIGWEPARVAARVDQLAALVQLPNEVLARYPLEMSGGQRQRVGLMRALMLDPDVLILDEPLTALDPLVVAQLEEDLRVIFESLDKTVILVTHDMAQAAYLAQTIAVMKDGAILQRGTARELLDDPASPFVTTLLRAHRTIA